MISRWTFENAEFLDWVARTVEDRKKAGTVPPDLDTDAIAGALESLIRWIDTETDPHYARKSAYTKACRTMDEYDASKVTGISREQVNYWTADRRFDRARRTAMEVWRSSLPPMAPSLPVKPGRHGIRPTAEAGCECDECAWAVVRSDAARARFKTVTGRDMPVAPAWED